MFCLLKKILVLERWGLKNLSQKSHLLNRFGQGTLLLKINLDKKKKFGEINIKVFILGKKIVIENILGQNNRPVKIIRSKNIVAEERNKKDWIKKIVLK